MKWIPVAYNASEIVVGQIEFLIKQKREGLANDALNALAGHHKQTEFHSRDKHVEEAFPSKFSPVWCAWVIPNYPRNTTS
jgi:hypothetical protein